MLRYVKAAPFASYRLLQSTFAMPSFAPLTASFISCCCFFSERGSARLVGAVALSTLSLAPGSRDMSQSLWVEVLDLVEIPSMLLCTESIDVN